MKYIFFSLLLLLPACFKHESDGICGYKPGTEGHYLRVPVTISPHQLQYRVGDTMHINTIFPDSIYDIGTQLTFKIRNFPFKPKSLLYHFIDSITYDSGYRVNALSIDSFYQPMYKYSSVYADTYQARAIYENDWYRFESQLILKEPGRYILTFYDAYHDNLGSDSDILNAEANALQFEGRCPSLPLLVFSMIDSGDDQLDLFENELVYLDKEVYREKLRHTGTVLTSLGDGSIPVEECGYFGFEVVE